MKDPDRKDNRRQNLQNNFKHKLDISEEQKLVRKAKKQLKKKIEDTRADEAWEDWESGDEIY